MKNPCSKWYKGYELCTIDQVGSRISMVSHFLSRQTVEKRAWPMKKGSKVKTFKTLRDLRWEICT